MPPRLEQGVVYVSIEYATAAHLCACGCGAKVVTPISPTDWQLTFDGDTVSLHPSIGNWSYPCRSHYFLRRNHVVWAGDMPVDAIARGREYDRKAKDAYHAKASPSAFPTPAAPKTDMPTQKRKWWQRLLGG
ncbi:MAG: DUF6527 family protein [Bradyrhizobium sp.]|nr:DUF6527 family protein [Bradyrhizobium sp.]